MSLKLYSVDTLTGSPPSTETIYKYGDMSVLVVSLERKAMLEPSGDTTSKLKTYRISVHSVRNTMFMFESLRPMKLLSLLVTLPL